MEKKSRGRKPNSFRPLPNSIGFGGPHFAFSNASAFRAAFASDQKGKQIIVITMVRIAQTTFMGVPIFTKSLKR